MASVADTDTLRFGVQDLRMIKEHWNWLVNDMSTACSFFTRESEKEENELWDFLLMKFTSMAQQEAKKRVPIPLC
jgi:hypothetical protein